MTNRTKDASTTAAKTESMIRVEIARTYLAGALGPMEEQRALLAKAAAELREAEKTAPIVGTVPQSNGTDHKYTAEGWLAQGIENIVKDLDQVIRDVSKEMSLDPVEDVRGWIEASAA